MSDTPTIAALRAALPDFKGWSFERVEPRYGDDGQADIGTSFDDGGFAPIITVDAGLYNAEDRAMPLARAVSAACLAAPELLAELDRLRACLAKANSQTEHFEREWYLRGDALEAMQADRDSWQQQASDRVDDAVAAYAERDKLAAEVAGLVGAQGETDQTALMAAAGGWRHLLPLGYAPGNYMGKCHDCGNIEYGLDKRAVRCRPCAEKAHAERCAAPAPRPKARTPYIRAETILDLLDDEDQCGGVFAAGALAAPQPEAPAAVQPVPAGYWLAPDEPTEAMLNAVQREMSWCLPTAIYAKMRAAHLATGDAS